MIDVPGMDYSVIEKHVTRGHGPADQWKHSPTGKRGKKDVGTGGGGKTGGGASKGGGSSGVKPKPSGFGGTKRQAEIKQVTQNGKKYWNARITNKHPDGKTTFVSSTLHSTEDEARARAKKRNAEITSGKSPSPSPDQPTRGRFSGTGTKDDPIRTGDVEIAANALFEGKHVELEEKRQVSVLLDKLHKKVSEAKEKDGNVPNIDLCSVTVKNTNLFCALAVVHAQRDPKTGKEKGARAFMPQLKAVPKPGSKAAKLGTADPENGEVDLQPMFQEMLINRGVKVERTKHPASFLKPSQEYLSGVKVAGMMNSMENQRLNRPGRKMNLEGSPVFVSRDDYIVDGHHRWAALVGVDFADDKEGDVQMDIVRIDMPILDLLDEANKFAKEWGMEPVEKTLLRRCECQTEFDQWVADEIEKQKDAIRERIRNRNRPQPQPKPQPRPNTYTRTRTRER